jgi:hypothetical protein
MKEDAIFQFVGFETALSLENFTVQWENFARRFFKKNVHSITLQQQVTTRSKFKYISRNKWPRESFSFVFMEGRISDHFPAHEVKVVQTGGYMPMQIEAEDSSAAMDDIKVLAFITDERADLDAFRLLPCRSLNIYEAYYESCLYAYVLEFYVSEEVEATDLVATLKKQYAHLEIGMYKESLVLEG